MAQLLTFGPNLQGAIEAGVLTPEQAWMLAWAAEMEPDRYLNERELIAHHLVQWHLTPADQRPILQ